jgi:hypothetical protein
VNLGAKGFLGRQFSGFIGFQPHGAASYPSGVGIRTRYNSTTLGHRLSSGGSCDRWRGGFVMRTVKFALVLPVVQAIGAVVLLHIAGPLQGPPLPTARVICWGLSAPALLFRALTRLTRGRLLGFQPDDVFFLLGVVVVWYFVGRTFDRRPAHRSVSARGIVTALIACSILVTVGGLLLLTGWQGLHPRLGVLPINPYPAVFMLIWAGGLFFLSGRAIVKTVRNPRNSA